VLVGPGMEWLDSSTLHTGAWGQSAEACLQAMESEHQLLAYYQATPMKTKPGNAAADLVDGEAGTGNTTLQ
jgi:hypothetical protein